jgi:pteridine reductase
MSEQRRIALVTGGAKRVGRAIVEKLAADGFDGAFTYLSSKSEAEQLRRSLLEIGATFVPIQADLTRPDPSCEQIAAAMSATFGRLDVLVNCASLYEKADLAVTTLETTRRLWAIHVESPLLLCQRFASLLRQSRGSVVNMLDLLAERPWPQYLPYCASKAGLWNLTLGLARELAPQVTVNGIAPGVVDWPTDYPEAEREKYLKRVPLGRAGTPQNVADTVHFLCTAGSYITGQIIRLDGGRSIT